jgi:regulator of replication initiation timing
LSDRNASKEQLAKAQEMIKELNGKIDDLGAQVEKLSAENKQLTASNEQLNTDKTQLATEKAAVQDNLTKTQQEKAHVEDLASTLHASNINIEGVQLKGGGTEKETDKAKHVNYFKVSFNIDENRISPSGTKQFYVIVYNPDGTPSTPAGNFTTRDNGDKPYTNKVEVNYEQGKLTPVSFTWKPGDKFQTGDYKVEIYNNGFKIGEGKKTLKKSGFLGL